MYDSPPPPEEENTMEHLENLNMLLKQQLDVNHQLSEDDVAADAEIPESPLDVALLQSPAVKEGADESLQGEVSSVDMQRRDSVSSVGGDVFVAVELSGDVAVTEVVAEDVAVTEVIEDAAVTEVVTEEVAEEVTEDFCPRDIRRKKKKAANKPRSSPDAVDGRLPKDIMLEFLNEQQSSSSQREKKKERRAAKAAMSHKK
nr:uncharacterized protein LOC129381295 [Dermacentor andersoni]